MEAVLAAGSVGGMAPASAQINARIGSDLKRAGDAGLAAADLGPSQAIRALWELAAQYADAPEKLLAALFPQRVADEEDELDLERKRRADAVARGACLVEHAYRDAGLPWPPASASCSYDELRDAAYAEEYGAMMGWS